MPIWLDLINLAFLFYAFFDCARTEQDLIRTGPKWAWLIGILLFESVAGIAWFILPKLATVFEGLHIELPTVTRIVIGIGVFLDVHGLVAIPAFLIVIGVIVYILFFLKPSKFIGNKEFTFGKDVAEKS